MEEEVTRMKAAYGSLCTAMGSPARGYNLSVRLPGYSGCSIRCRLPATYPAVKPDVTLRGSDVLPSDKRREIERLISEENQIVSVREIVDSVFQRLSLSLPMKPCRDVVARILQDDKLSADSFTVGYFHRLYGLLEEEFTKFTWDAQVPCGGIKLSVPHNRILYFKYKDMKVWDRAAKLDLIFKCDIISLYDAITKMDKEETQEWEGAQSGLAPRDTKVKDRSKKPNHFICLRIKDPIVLEKIADVQEDIIVTVPMCAEYFAPAATAHITVCVMKLESEEELATVVGILESSKQELSQMARTQHRLQFKGVGHFGNSVFFGRVSNPAALEAMCKHIKARLATEEINLTANFGKFHPHLTIFKGIDKAVARKGGDYMTTFKRKFGGFSFGSQQLDELFLCPMVHEKQSDGFYHCLASVSLDDGET